MQRAEDGACSSRRKGSYQAAALLHLDQELVDVQRPLGVARGPQVAGELLKCADKVVASPGGSQVSAYT